jgi:hypothetical protein
MEVLGMRTLLRMLFCGVVIAAIGGCGGGGETQIPTKFAPQPDKNVKPTAEKRTSVTLPGAKAKGG